PTTAIYTLSLHDALPILIESLPLPPWRIRPMLVPKSEVEIEPSPTTKVSLPPPAATTRSAPTPSMLKVLFSVDAVELRPMLSTPDRKSTRLNSSHVAISY